VVDALDKRVHELHATSINMYQTNIKRKILEATNADPQYRELVAMLQQGKMPQKVDNYNLGIDGILLRKNNFFFPNVQDLKCMIFHEMHNVPYVGHPGYQKIVATIKSHYFWPSMKKEIVEYITRCMEFQNVNAENRHPTGLLQPLTIPEWKWEVVTMDFITGFPRTCKLYDSIMVVVDKIKKDAHLIPLKTTHKSTYVADIFMKEVA
jgi:hypothetical protein